MRRYSCNLCEWRGLPHANIRDLINPVYYGEAMAHVADDHPERLLTPPLTVQVWHEKVQSLASCTKVDEND